MLPDEFAAEPSATDATFADMRAKPRFALLIRCAKLVTGDGEFLCIVRDVSEGGVRLRFFHPVPVQGPMALVLPTGETFAAQSVWTQGQNAGFSFARPIDVHRFIAETGPFPKRALRLRVTIPAAIMVSGESHTATVLDISCQGMRIETAQPLALGQKVRLIAEGLPGIWATVCWRTAPSYGLVLDRVFSLEELAERTAQMQLGLTAPSQNGCRRHA